MVFSDCCNRTSKHWSFAGGGREGGGVGIGAGAGIGIGASVGVVVIINIVSRIKK